MTKEQEERIRKLEAHRDNLYNWARDNRKRIDVLEARLGLLEKAHNKTVEKYGNFISCWMTTEETKQTMKNIICSLRVEEKT